MAVSGSETPFGHLSCTILSNIPEIKFKNDLVTESVYKKLKMITERRLHRPLYYQVMLTMYAAILFKAGPEKRTESLRYLNAVLDDDETNITALSDLEYIYRYMSDFREASNYGARMKEILRKNDNLSLARAYYDKAHIIRHFEQDKRKFSYFEFLEKSKYHIGMVNTTEGSRPIDTERGEILFDYSLSLYRKYYQKVEFGALQIQKSNGMLDKAIESFIDVIEIAKSPSDCKALSYIFIAILLRLKLEFDKRIGETNFYVNKRLAKYLRASIDRLNVLENDQLFVNMRSECLERGLNLAKYDSNVLRRVASEYTHLMKLDEAEEYFKESIRIEESWFAYRHQGILYLNMYEMDASEKKEDLLDKAKCSFTSALKMKETHADLSDIGYICMLQGKNKHNRHDREALMCFNEAKMRFADAVKLKDCDDYFNPIETYERWGQCLQLTDEDQGGLGLRRVRQMSVDHEESLRLDVDVSRNQPSISRSIFKTSDEQHSFYVIKSKADYQWVINQLLPKLEGEYYNQKGFLKERDKILGEDFVTVLVEAIRISKYIVVILSNNFESCSWCQYELNLALNDAVSGSRIIIPIMLEGIDIPFKLKPICEENLIKTANGAINDSGWDKLKYIFDK